MAMGQRAGTGRRGHWPEPFTPWRVLGSGRKGPMASSVEYRRNAENCLRQAEDADSSEAKSVLMMMAAAWHRMAQDQENKTRLLADIEAAHSPV